MFQQVFVDTAAAMRLRGLPDAAAQLAAALIDQQCALFGGDTALIGDAGAVCAVIDQAGISTELLPVRVEVAPGLARGATLVDRRSWDGDRATDPPGAPATDVDVALRVDAGRYATLWLSAFES